MSNVCYRITEPKSNMSYRSLKLLPLDSSILSSLTYTTPDYDLSTTSARLKFRVNWLFVSLISGFHHGVKKQTPTLIIKGRLVTNNPHIGCTLFFAIWDWLEETRSKNWTMKLIPSRCIYVDTISLGQHHHENYEDMQYGYGKVFIRKIDH